MRSRERDTRTQKEILKEREMEEEEKEIKRAARKAEEKELIYQVLLSVPFTFPWNRDPALLFSSRYLQFKGEIFSFLKTI